MITVSGNNIYYNTTHLVEPKPTTFNKVVERLKGLDCRLFYNVISSPGCNYETKYGKGRIKEEYQQMSAEDRFKNIFTKKTLYANPKSFFVNKMNKKPNECDSIKSVSFTLCERKNLDRHFKTRGSEFGICFFHDFLQNKGIRPVIHINKNEQVDNRALVFNSPHLLKVITGNYDMQWEDEWRIKEDLHFTKRDIAFVIIPHDRFEYFYRWFRRQEDFQDIQLISSTAYKCTFEHLIELPGLPDNAWGRRIELSLRSDGRKNSRVALAHFDSISHGNRIKFKGKYAEELRCLAKNVILSKFENKFIARYLEFTDSLHNISSMQELFGMHNNIVSNFNEPDDAEHDLVSYLFEKMLKYHPVSG